MEGGIPQSDTSSISIQGNCLPLYIGVLASIPAFLSLLCVPLPFLFWKYGPAIRAKCKYAAEAAAFTAKMQNQADADDESGEEGDEKESGVDSDEAADDAKKHVEEKEEAEDPIENSPSSVADRPRLEPIKSRSSGRPTTLRKYTSYDASPFDLDRTNTRTSFRYEARLQRTASSGNASGK